MAAASDVATARQALPCFGLDLKLTIAPLCPPSADALPAAGPPCGGAPCREARSGRTILRELIASGSSLPNAVDWAYYGQIDDIDLQAGRAEPLIFYQWLGTLESSRSRMVLPDHLGRLNPCLFNG